MSYVKYAAVLSAALVILAAAPSANAALVINITEVGFNVFAFGSGTFNTTGLSVLGSSNIGPTLGSNNGIVLVGSGASTIYSVASKSLGNGPDVAADSSTGSLFGVRGVGFYLPTGYVSSTSLNGSATINNKTLAGLGFRLGTYTYNLPNDTLTINVAPGLVPPAPVSSVPEPSAWAMMIAGFGLVGVHCGCADVQ